MASEFTPTGRGARMTKAQVRRYIREMKAKREEAKKKLEAYEASGELEKEREEVAELEEQLENIGTSSSQNDEIDTINWQQIPIEQFLETYKLETKIFGIAILSPELEKIFSKPIVGSIHNTVKDFLQIENNQSIKVYTSELYKGYLYIIKDTEIYMIKTEKTINKEERNKE